MHDTCGPTRLIGCAVALLGMLAFGAAACADQILPLILQDKILLGDAVGRMDHFALDPTGQRLFLAELGNNSVAVIDLKSRHMINRLTGFSEPQGVGYLADTQTLYVANGGTGVVQLFQGTNLAPAGQISLDSDADNIHIDSASGRVFVGYGNGGVAVIAGATQKVVADFPLAAHPEGFQIDATASVVFVNLPSAGQTDRVDLASGKVTAWKNPGVSANFPMAIDPATNHVLVAYRSPPKLLVIAPDTGNTIESLDICSDADDVFVDSARARLYISCGTGVIDVFQATQTGYRLLAEIPTVAGARTAFFDPDLDQLFIAARASGSESAAVLVYQPQD